MMSKTRKGLSWALIILLGLVNGILKEFLFITILVPNLPASLDLPGKKNSGFLQFLLLRFWRSPYLERQRGFLV